VEGHARNGVSTVTPRHSRHIAAKSPSTRGEHFFLGDEAHLDIDLSVLGLAVGAVGPRRACQRAIWK